MVGCYRLHHRLAGTLFKYTITLAVQYFFQPIDIPLRHHVLAAADMVLYVENMVRNSGTFCIAGTLILHVMASASELLTGKR